MNWVSRKVHLYNVTMGLYMLDRWERWLFNIMMLTLLWFVCHSAPRYAKEVFDSHMESSKLLVSGSFPFEGIKPT